MATRTDIQWGRTLAAALAAETVGLLGFLALFGNPLSRRLIYSPALGQSEKLLAVWTTLPPAPALTPLWGDLLAFTPRKVLALGLLYLWAFGLALVYLVVSAALPGRGWRKGLAFGLGLWATVFPLLEVFFPFNLLGEPLYLVAYELLLEVPLALGIGVSLAAVLETSAARRSGPRR